MAVTSVKYGDIYANRIRSLCNKRGISINKLSTMCGLKQSTLDNIMRGITQSPGAKTLHKVANAFNMTLAEFLDFDELNEYSFEDQEDED